MMHELIKEMLAYGLDAPAPMLDGEIHRCQHNGSKDTRGWYAGVTVNGNIYAHYGSWDDQQWQEFRPNGSSSNISKRDVQILNAISEKRKAERAVVQEESASKAQKYLAGLEDIAPDDHGYLISKDIKVADIHIDNGLLVIPAYDGASYIGYQTIAPDGAKKFNYGLRKKGSFHPIKGAGRTILICEGFATGASLAEATGYTVLVAWDAGNLLSVTKKAVSRFASHSLETDCKIIVCADNDHIKNGTNTGIEAAKKVCATLFGVDFIAPPDSIKGTDFNDMANELGLEAVSELIKNGKILDIFKPETTKILFEKDILNPPGLLKDIADYFNQTSIQNQPILAVATGIILGSIVCARRYKTQFNNYSSLYTVIAATSGTGKDYVKEVVRTILTESGLGELERGGGFTAANTVIKSLQKQPTQISFFEEFGQRMVEASKGQTNAKGVFRQLLDIWSSNNTKSVGEEYADGSIPSVVRPALSLVGLTTTKTFFRAITEDLIEQGFINRILPFISDNEVSAVDLDENKSLTVIPKKIIDWCQDIWGERDASIDIKSGESSDFDISAKDEILIPFSAGAIVELNDINKNIVEYSIQLKKFGLEDMLTRNRELVMKISLIITVMSGEDFISRKRVKWAHKLVLSMYDIYISKIKRLAYGSDFEKAKLEALESLRKRGAKGIPPGDMPKKAPWSKFEPRMRVEIIEDLIEAGLAAWTKVRTGKRGPGKKVFVALK